MLKMSREEKNLRKNCNWGKRSTVVIQGYMREATAGNCQLYYMFFTSDPRGMTVEGSEFQSVWAGWWGKKAFINISQIKILQIHLPNCIHSLGSGQVCLLIYKDASYIKDSHVSSAYHSNSKCLTQCLKQNKHSVICWTNVLYVKIQVCKDNKN